jgi:hypothetical protein
MTRKESLNLLPNEKFSIRLKVFLCFISGTDFFVWMVLVF